MRNRYPNRKIIAAFEPRSNTSRLDIMREPMLNALARADRVVIGPAKQRSSKSVVIMDTEALAAGLMERGVEAVASRSNDAALESLRAFCADDNGNQVVVFLTNGSFDGIIERFLEAN